MTFHAQNGGGEGSALWAAYLVALNAWHAGRCGGQAVIDSYAAWATIYLAGDSAARDRCVADMERRLAARGRAA